MGGKKKWYILILMCLGILAAQYSQFLMSQLGMTWLAATGNDNADTAQRFSTLITAPLIAGAVLSLASGALVDRFGIKRVLMVSLSVMLTGVTARIWVTNYYVMFVCMVSIGAVTTFFNANIMKLAGTWFGTMAAFAIGIFSAVNSVASAFGTVLGAVFGDNYRAAFISAAVFGAVIWILWAVTPGVDGGKNATLGAAEIEQKPAIREALAVVLRSRNVWILAAAMMCVSVAGNAAGLFLPEAFKARGISAGAAGIATLFGILGSAAFNLVSPRVIGKFRRPRAALAVIGVIGAACVGFAWLLELGPLMYFGLFVGGMCSYGLTPVLLQLPLSFAEIGKKYAGTAGGVIATIQLGGCVIIPTYLLLPLSHGNNTVFFALEGSLLLIFAAIAFVLPIRSVNS
ncbi:MAG: MFS transporter [Oscillospiraceae bacterium]|nr:MFS transporter [Oscillospiraceae bacterium]